MKHKGLKLFLLLCVLVGVWWYNNYTVKTVSEEYPSAKVKSPVRIMVIADLHATLYGISNESLTERVEEADPDFVVMLGDMYTRRSPWELIQIPIDLTAGIVQKGYPVYYITGDHDTSKEYKEAISKTGAHLLDYKEEVVEYINVKLKEASFSGKKTGVIATDETADRYEADSIKTVGSRQDESMIAHRLYTILREFDDEGIEIMYSECFDTGGLGQAIMNRLLKAAGHQLINI